MPIDLLHERQQAHAYLDRLPAAQLAAVRTLLESMVDPCSTSLANAPIDEEEISDEEQEAVQRSKEWFKHNKGASLEDVAAELGFSMDDIRNAKECA